MVATDWTYDLYVNDVESTDEIKDKWRKNFITYMKEIVNEFKTNWLKDHDGKLYDGEWVGDAFAGSDYLDCFSDYYKDAYNQRPHLDMWYYIHPLGLPMREDSFRTFCSDPIDSAKYSAKFIRENY